MKRLMLIRHGKSSWKDPDIVDFDRPLNRRGKGDAPEMGRRLASRGERPDLIVTSPAKRAVSTMNRIAREIGFTESRILRDDRVYEAGGRELLSIIRKFEDMNGYVVLCGHNPGLTDLCNLVSDLTIDNLPTCGVVSIEFPVDSWDDVAAGSGLVRYFDFPKRAFE
jgi:phosphohistidine phosphatase